MTALSHAFTILRQSDADPRTDPRPIVAADVVPLTADSESRATAAVRSTSWDMVERFPRLEPVEALCHLEATNDADQREPGILLLDRRAPIWLAVLDDRAFISVDTELLDGAARARFQVAAEYLGFLAQRGYAHLFDHRTRTWHRGGGGASDVVGRLTVGATTRRFDELKTDWRFGFLGGFLAIFVFDVVLNAQPGRSLWASVVKGLVLGSFINGMQYIHAHRALNERLRQLRAEILSGQEPTEHLTFRKRAKTVWGEALGVLFIGAIAIGALTEDFWGNIWIGVPIFCLAAAVLWSLVHSRRVFVVLDGQAIEGLATRRRNRIPYVDVDRICEYRTLGSTTISSADRVIHIPNYLERYLQLVDLVWDRVSSAVPEGAAPLLHGRAQSPARFESILRDARARTSFIWTVLRARWPPLWMHVFHRQNPLRRQYRWHPHLLRHGRVALGLVVVADDKLWELAREEFVFDASAVVLFAPDLAVDEAGDVLEEVLARVRKDDDDDDVDGFRRALGAQGPYPLDVVVPESLARGTRVVCSSLMVVRRYVPLGQLRSPWIPLLIDPSACPFATVLPARYWDPEWRRSWKTPITQKENG